MRAKAVLAWCRRAAVLVNQLSDYSAALHILYVTHSHSCAVLQRRCGRRGAGARQAVAARWRGAAAGGPRPGRRRRSRRAAAAASQPAAGTPWGLRCASLMMTCMHAHGGCCLPGCTSRQQPCSWCCALHSMFLRLQSADDIHRSGPSPLCFCRPRDQSETRPLIHACAAAQVAGLFSAAAAGIAMPARSRFRKGEGQETDMVADAAGPAAPAVQPGREAVSYADL